MINNLELAKAVSSISSLKERLLMLSSQIVELDENQRQTREEMITKFGQFETLIKLAPTTHDYDQLVHKNQELEKTIAFCLDWINKEIKSKEALTTDRRTISVGLITHVLWIVIALIGSFAFAGLLLHFDLIDQKQWGPEGQNNNNTNLTLP